MISSGVLIACAVFGAGAFGFFVGFFTSSAKAPRAEVFPLTHVSFDSGMSRLEKLRFLDMAAELVRKGALGQPDKLGDNATSNDKE